MLLERIGRTAVLPEIPARRFRTDFSPPAGITGMTKAVPAARGCQRSMLT
ncbi:hypothetical protein CSC33_2671 [Pseudomonas aeruginosa]|nr:hypothetical protein CSC33_2671 [Pseudomonas aeruginosa]